MASSTPQTRSNSASAAPMVSQTYRVAAKVGDDFVTVETTVTLPVGASDAMVEEAVRLSTRIHTAQLDAVNAQVQASRFAAIQSHENAPATADQQRAIARVVAAKHPSEQALADLAGALNIDRAHLTKTTAGVWLDALQGIRVNGNGAAAQAAAPAPVPAATADVLFGGSGTNGHGDASGANGTSSTGDNPASA